MPESRRVVPLMRPLHPLQEFFFGPDGRVQSGPCNEWRDRLAAGEDLAPHWHDWLFPADLYASSVSTFPSLPVLALQAWLRDAAVLRQLLLNYAAFLGTVGLTVDHHGWLYAMGPGLRSGPALDLEGPGVMRLARVLRCLHLSGLCGHSRSGYRDPDGYSYAVALRHRLDETATKAGLPLSETPWRTALVGPQS